MTLPDSSLPLPHVLGPYRLEQTLGRGGMGIVYEAYDQRLDRRVAVKRLLSGRDDPERRARLRREARTTARLDHPAIIQVFDWVEDDQGDWIVMERLHGTALATLLESRAARCRRRTVELRPANSQAAWQAAHAQEIIHRDLKTENVMILADGQGQRCSTSASPKTSALLMTARGLGIFRRLALIVGTGRAMSPEQARGLEMSGRGRTFSRLGILLYECLRPASSPFRGETPVDTLARIVSHQPQPVEEASSLGAGGAGQARSGGS